MYVNEVLHKNIQKPLTTQFKYTIFTYVEKKTRGNTMVNMTKFHEILLDAINLANKKIRNRISSEIVGNELHLEIRREKQGSYNCINSTLLSVHPSGMKNKMEIEEVWVGYDGEGSPWSDHMGGRIVDCNGKNIQGAIELIAAELNTLINQD